MSIDIRDTMGVFSCDRRPVTSGPARPGLPRAWLLTLCCWLAIPVAAWAETPGALVGHWTSPAFAAVAEACSNAVWIFSEDGSMQIISGPQVITGTYHTETAGGDAFILVQSDLTSNGEPNCQGIDAGTVLDNYVRRAYVVLGADQLTLHMGEDPQSPSFTMTRER